MKKYIFFFVLIVILLSLKIVIAEDFCSTGYIGSQCCAEIISEFDYCVEGIDWGYCEFQYPQNCINDFWSPTCCCNGTIALKCNPIPNPGNKVWGDTDCGRLNATINCDSVPNSHKVCNTTYYPPATGKCTLIEPKIKNYYVSNSKLILGNTSNISVNGECPVGLPGKCLIECKIIKPDLSFIELDSWDVDGSATLPSFSCSQIGNYKIERCGVYTDFTSNSGWGEENNTVNYVKCVLELTQPTYGYNMDNSQGAVIAGTEVNVYVLWNDNQELNNAIFRLNKGLQWSNVSSCSLSGISKWCNTTISTTTSDIGKTFCWNQWANDSSDNWNNTMPVNAHCFYINEPPDILPPTYRYDMDDSQGSVNERTLVNISALWSDNKGLSYANFMHNETGYWIVNSTTLSGIQGWYNYTLNTSGYGNEIICWKENSTDTSGNINNTMPNNAHCFNVIMYSEATSQTTVEPFYDTIRSISSSSADFSMNVISLLFQFIGIIILTIMLIMLVQHLLQSL